MIKVTLQKDKDYWKLAWREGGHQRGHSIGRRKDVGGVMDRRQAVKVMVETEERLNRTTTEVPRLQDWLETYLASHTYAEGTVKLYRGTAALLMGFPCGNAKIDAVTRQEASAWRRELLAGNLEGQIGKPSVATVNRIVRQAKALFEAAVEEGIIAVNPYGHLDCVDPPVNKDWPYVDAGDFERLRGQTVRGFRMLLALCRWAGLRRGEALTLKWADWSPVQRRLTVHGKGGRKRTVPVSPLLHAALLDWKRFVDSREAYIVCHLSKSSLHGQFAKAFAAAGIVPWHSPCHTLRKSCEADWLKQFNLKTVADWMGHSPEVALKYYTRAEEDEFARAVKGD
jgi:integrase